MIATPPPSPDDRPVPTPARRRRAALGSMAVVGLGTALLAAMTGAALALNLRYGLDIYAERLVAGLASCL